MRVAGWPAFKNRRVNPYNWLLYTHLARLGVQVEEFSPFGLLLGRYDIWHVHWPEFGLGFRPLWRAIAWFIAVLSLLAVARIRRVRVVWTIHNLGSHEGAHPRLEALFWRLFLHGVDGVLALSSGGLTMACERFGEIRNRPARVVPLGDFRGVYPSDLSRCKARERLQLPDTSRVLTFFGLIRPYKNVPSLIRTFRQLHDSDLRLLVVGEPYSMELRSELENLRGSDDRIQLHLGFQDDSQVQVYLDAADLVVLPFTDVLNSASAVLALSFDRPVLVPRIGAMGELQSTAGTDWVRTFDGELSPDILAEALQWARTTRRDPTRLRNAFAWPWIAEQTRAAYAAFLDQP